MRRREATVGTWQPPSEAIGARDSFTELLGLLDADAVLERAVHLVPGSVGVDCAFIGEPSANGDITLRHLVGCGTDALQDLVVRSGRGLGGKVLEVRRPVWVDDYVAAHTITHEYDPAIVVEGLRAMVSVPIISGSRVYGLLYGAFHRPVAFGDRGLSAMFEAGRQVAAAVTVAERARHAAEIRVHEERRRLGLAMHDGLGARLFAITARVGELRRDGELPPLAQALLSDIERDARGAAAALRESLRALSASPEELELGVTLRADCRSFEARTGTPARLIALTELPPLDPTRVGALVAMAREALLNVEKHAEARSVVVSVYTAANGVAIAVSDDGVGLGGSHTDGTGLGIEASGERLRRLGGNLQLLGNDDGGVTVQGWIPL